MVTKPKIKDDKIILRIFSDDGKELETFMLKDNSIFTLVSPEQTYSIIQEVKTDCDLLSKNFNNNIENIICPDTQSYRLQEGIAVTKDTSFRIRLVNPSEFYSLPVVLPENINLLESNFKSINISEEPNNEDNTSDEAPFLEQKEINIADLIKHGRICITGSQPSTNTTKAQECTFAGKNIKTITVFKANLNNITSQDRNLNFLLSFLSNAFNDLEHNLLFEFEELTKTANPGIEINQESPKKFFLDSYNFKFNINLGKIKKTKSKIIKNVFSLKSPFELNTILSKVILKIPFNNLEALIKPFSDKNNESILTNLTINSIDKNNTILTNLSIGNNVVVKDLIESTPTPSSNIISAQAIPPSGEEDSKSSNLQISSYFPSNDFIFDVKREYLFVETNTAPSVDEKGKPIEVINNKSKEELVFSKSFGDVSLVNTLREIVFDLEQVSKFIENKDFIKQLGLSGFLIPPDLRPVLETDYRATLELSMIVNLDDKNSVKIIFSDLKTKDETPLTNFFQFSFLPKGEYEAIIKFDADRKKFFENAGILSTDKD